MKSIKKIFLAVGLLSAIICFSGCVSQTNIGKTGTIKVSIGSHCSVTKIDGESCFFIGSIKLDPGIHTIHVEYSKTSGNYKITGAATKEFLFEEGKKYTIKGYEGKNGRLFCPIREVGMEKNSQLYSSITGFEDPTTSDGKNIQFLNMYPQDRDYEIAGECQIILQGGIFATKTMTFDRALLFLKEYAAENNIDALVDVWVADDILQGGLVANAIGIRLTDGKGAVSQNPFAGKVGNKMAAMFAYVGNVLEYTSEGSTKKVTLISPLRTIEYLPDMGVVIKEGNVEKRGHIGFVTNINDGVGVVYTKFDNGSLTKDQFVDMANEDADYKWEIADCTDKILTLKILKPQENEGLTETFMILVTDLEKDAE